MGAVLVPGFTYWLLIGANPIRCIYGDAACSLTVSTYLLGALTALVVLATIIGALYAKSTFEREREAVLSLQRCTKGRCAHAERAVYLVAPGGTFSHERPAQFNATTWISDSLDCTSIGKSPVIAADIELRPTKLDEIDLPTPTPRDEIAPLGTVKPGDDAHVRLWFPPEFPRMSLAIRRARHQAEDLAVYLVGDTMLKPALEQELEREEPASQPLTPSVRPPTFVTNAPGPIHHPPMLRENRGPDLVDENERDTR